MSKLWFLSFFFGLSGGSRRIHLEVVHLQNGTQCEKNGKLIINQQDATFH